jgi:phenylpropionate dioxygenase-like ring-hydroxylating dioxygenase large terminal subunit
METSDERSNGSPHHEFVIEGQNEFKVSPAIYTDERIFDEELNKIFNRCWVYVGHESEIEKPGDYRTTHIGRAPLILSRGQDQRIHLMFNTCRHRGNTVCRDERGHADSFRCPYHGWTYDASGNLTVLAEGEGYAGAMTAELGLVQAPRVASYRGLIFGSLSPKGESLEDYLGEAKKYVDLWAERSPTGVVRLHRPHKFIYPGNWKLQADNGHDSYHGRYVHESAMKTLERSVGRSSLEERKTARHGQGSVRAFPRGHGLLERPGGRGELPTEMLGDYMNRLVEAYGAERAEQIAMVRHVFIFPNLYLMDDNVRVIWPVSAGETLVYSHFAAIGGVSDVMNSGRLKNLQWRLGQTGFFATDDLEMFAGCQSGMRGTGMDSLNLSRGLHRETTSPTGERFGPSSDEAPQRSLYREWARLMAEA